MSSGLDHDTNDYAARQTATSLASLGQVLVNLTETNTRALLSGAAEDLLQPQRRAEATATLTRLQDLNPALAKNFRLKEDTLGAIPLRMVLSSPRRAEESVPSFIVVSYCWQYPEWPISRYARPIAPGWKISLPMVHAIMGHRRGPDEGVWMDQLCIDQDDAQEKIVHIGAMNLIYRAARRMIILLEDVELTAEEDRLGRLYAQLYQTLTEEVAGLPQGARSEYIEDYFPRQAKAHNLLEPAYSKAIRSFSRKMMGARWYTRAWCAHESRTAPHRKVDNPLLLCYGHDGAVLSFEFRFVYFLAYHLCKTEPSEMQTGEALVTVMKAKDPTSIRMRWYRMIRLMPDAQEGDKSPMQHLVSVLNFGCLEKGDLVSIALNTSGLPLVYGGKLRTAEEAHFVFSVLALASGDLTPVVMSGGKLRVTDGGEDEEVVSWLVDSMNGLYEAKLPLTVEGSITAATTRYIELDLLVFESQPRDCTVDTFQKTKGFIEEHGLMVVHREMIAAADSQVREAYRALSAELSRLRPDGNGPLDTLHPRFIGLALDAGLHWMLGFADVMERLSWTDWSYGSTDTSAAIEARLVEPAYALLSLFGVQRDSMPPGYVDKTVRFLSLLVDPRLPFLTTSPRRLPIGPGASDSVIVPTGSNRSWVAVPTAVAHLPAWQERAWIIERADEDGNAPSYSGPLLTSDSGDERVCGGSFESGNWVLRRRERIWGADLRPLLSGDGRHEGCVTLLKRQRVYGAEDYDWKAAGEVARAAEAAEARKQAEAAEAPEARKQ